MPAKTPPGALASAWAVLAKDARSEWRSRVATTSLFLFAFSVLILVGYALGPTRLAPEDRPAVNSVLLWIVLFFSAMTGLPRAFVKEEETGTSAALRLAAPPHAILLGKLLLNLTLLLLLTAFVLPLFMGLMSFEIQGLPLFLGVVVLGDVGLAVASTLVAAIVSKASAKGTLFVVLALPLLLPPLVAAVTGTRVAAADPSNTAGLEVLRLLVAYDGVIGTASFLLFDAVWRE